MNMKAARIVKHSVRSLSAMALSLMNSGYTHGSERR